MKPFLQRLYREWLKPLAIILLIGTPLRSAVVDWNWVPTGSMKPTIVEGDLVLVNKLAYDLKIPFTTHHLAAWSNPQRGDIVVCFSPDDGTRLVKRVVGLPGDTLALRHDTLVVNGVAQHYTSQDASRYARDIFEARTPSSRWKTSPAPNTWCWLCPVGGRYGISIPSPCPRAAIS